MERHLAALYLYLKELDVDPSVQTLKDRKRVQKAVYLGQAAGADLGYRYSWYVHGPYSPALTKDYFDLADRLLETEAPELSLHPRLKERLASASHAFTPPHHSSLTLEEWLELLASAHYQMEVLGKTPEQTEDYLKSHPRKARLAEHLNECLRMLQEISVA